jgi:L-galactose dehydrogenase
MNTRPLGSTGLDVPVLSFGASSLGAEFADEMIPYLAAKGIGVMNAGPFSARLLTDAPLPAWLKEPEEVKAAARRAADLCRARGSSIVKLALQFALANPAIATTVAGSANPQNIRAWAAWADEPLDMELLRDVQAIFAPVKNVGHTEGLPENN